ncbi:MAG TPA: metallophosphoesterase [Thermoanaerobaculia bacterium]|nr:metallophosphoesterase [Thermoanaerobaculia bacterium]
MPKYGSLLLALLVVCPLRAANPTWVQYAPGGTLIARTILPANATCPAMNGTAMTVRGATTDVTVCEAVVPAGTTSASINGVALPLKNLGKTPKRIAVVGDTGCRVKCSSSGCSIQDCSDPTKWPAAAVAKSIAAWKPDLIVHVGDYYYREYNCPSATSQPSECTGPVYTWANWNADFFTPMAKLLPAAPWVFIRGNHEICSRAGAGWFQYLDGGAYSADCSTHSAPYSVSSGSMQFLVMDSSAVSDENVVPSEVTLYAGDFSALKATQPASPTAWLLLHHPIWGVVHDDEDEDDDDPVTPGLEAAWKQAAGADGVPNVAAIITGHVHLFEALQFSDAPPQVVIGNGGTKLDSGIKSTPKTVDTRTVTAFDTRDKFGWAAVTPTKTAGVWTFTLNSAKGNAKEKCTVGGMKARCGSAQ